MSTPQFYAWLACVFCVVFTLRCAAAFAQNQPLIFLALCIYAGHFAVLIIYYDTEPPASTSAPASLAEARTGPLSRVEATTEPEERHGARDLLPALSGYFAALAGFLIIRKHHHHKDETQNPNVRFSEEAVAWLLLLVALPRALASPFGRGLMPPIVTEAHIQVFVTLILDTIGYYALYRAVQVSHIERRYRHVLGAPLLLYWGLNITYSALQLYCRVSLALDPYEMPDTFRYAFAAVKVIAVLSFVPAVVSPYEPFRQHEWPKRLALLIYRD